MENLKFIASMALLGAVLCGAVGLGEVTGAIIGFFVGFLVRIHEGEIS